MFLFFWKNRISKVLRKNCSAILSNLCIIALSCIVLKCSSVNKKVLRQESDAVDDMDLKIIKELQENFPLEMNPYEVMAQNLNLSTDELWRRVEALASSGVIRRMGFSIDSRKIGYSSTLAAVRVPDDRVDEASELISAYPEITHSYLRADEFNIWFTVIAVDRNRIAAILEEIRLKLKLTEDDVMDLPVEKLFKLDARFK